MLTQSLCERGATHDPRACPAARGCPREKLDRAPASADTGTEAAALRARAAAGTAIHRRSERVVLRVRSSVASVQT